MLILFFVFYLYYSLLFLFILLFFNVLIILYYSYYSLLFFIILYYSLLIILYYSLLFFVILYYSLLFFIILIIGGDNFIDFVIFWIFLPLFWMYVFAQKTGTTWCHARFPSISPLFENASLLHVQCLWNYFQAANNFYYVVLHYKDS